MFSPITCDHRKGLRQAQARQARVNKTCVAVRETGCFPSEPPRPVSSKVPLTKWCWGAFTGGQQRHIFLASVVCKFSELTKKQPGRVAPLPGFLFHGVTPRSKGAGWTPAAFPLRSGPSTFGIPVNSGHSPPITARDCGNCRLRRQGLTKPVLHPVKRLLPTPPIDRRPCRRLHQPAPQDQRRGQISAIHHRQ